MSVVRLLVVLVLLVLPITALGQWNISGGRLAMRKNRLLSRITRFQRIFFFVVMLVISLSCTEHGKSPTQPEPPPEQSLEGSVEIPDAPGLDSESLVIYSNSDSTEVEGGQYDVNVAGDSLGSVLVACTPDGAPIALGFKVTESQMDIGPTSTAMALVLLNPYFLEGTTDQLAQLEDEIRTRPAFQELVQRIETGMRANGSDVLDPRRDPQIFQQANDLAKDVLPRYRDLQSSGQQGATEGAPTFEITGPNRVDFVNPYTINYGIRVQNGGRDSVVLLPAGEPRGWIIRSEVTPGRQDYAFSNGENWVLIDKGGGQGDHDFRMDPSTAWGLASFANVTQGLWYFASALTRSIGCQAGIRQIAGSIRSMPANDLRELTRLTETFQCLADLHEDYRNGDPIGFGKDLASCMTDHAGTVYRIMSRMVGGFDRGLAGQRHFEKLCDLLGSYFSLIDAQDQLRFAYDLVTAPQGANFEIVVNDGRIDQQFKSIELVSPAGGEKWVVGSWHTVEWTKRNIDLVSVLFCTEGDQCSGEIMNYTLIFGPRNATYFDWQVPDTPTEGCRIVVSEFDPEDGDPRIVATHPGLFSIVPYQPPCQADPIACGNEIPNVHIGRQETQWFRFSAQADAPITILVRGTSDLQPLHPAIKLYKDDCQTLLTSAGGEQQNAALIAGYSAPETAQYTISVSDLSEDEGDCSVSVNCTRDQVIPDRVRDLRIDSATPTQLTLKWTAPGDDGTRGRAWAYELRYSTDNGLPWDGRTTVHGLPYPSASGTTETATVDGLQPSTTYYFLLRTYDEWGNSSPDSNPASGQTSLQSGCPGQPLACGGQVGPIHLAAAEWHWYTFSGIAGAAVRIATSDGGGQALDTVLELYGPDCSSLLASNDDAEGSTYSLIEGFSVPSTATYNIMVRGYAPFSSGDYTLSLDCGTSNPPPGPIVDLGLVDAQSDRLALAWTAPSSDGATGVSATEYDLRYSTTSLSESNWVTASRAQGEPLPRTPGQRESFTLSGLQSNTTYHIAVKSRDERAGGWSNLSNEFIAMTDPAEDPPPGQVQDLVIGAVGERELTLHWSSPGADNYTGKATQYDIRYSRSAMTENTWAQALQASNEPTPKTAPSPESFTLTGLTPDADYWVGLKARDQRADGWSALSNVATGRTSTSVQPPTVDVQVPAAGAVVSIGSSAGIEWDPEGSYASVKIELSRDGAGGPWETLASYASTSARSWTWTPLTAPCTDHARIRVTLTGPGGAGSDISDADFKIANVPPALTTPSNGQSDVTMDTGFSWGAVAGASSYRFIVSNNAQFGSPQLAWKTVAGTTATLSGNWDSSNLTLQAGNTYYWKVAVNAGGCTFNWSPAYSFVFQDSAPSVQLSTPNGGQTAVLGDDLAVTWIPAGSFNMVKIELSRNGGNGPWEELIRYASGSATSWTWNPVAGACTDHARLRVSLTGPGGTGVDMSEADFRILHAAPDPSVPPDGSADVTTSTTFAWEAVAGASAYRFVISDNDRFGSPQLAYKTVSGTSTNLAGDWAASDLTLEVGSTYYWKVGVSAGGCSFNWSPARTFVFQEDRPVVQVQSPNGGEHVVLGTSLTVSWTATGAYTRVVIEASRNGENGPWESLADYASTNATSWTWNPVGGSCSGHARIRVKLTGAGGVGEDASNSDFEISYPPPTLTAPADGQGGVTTSTTFSWNVVPGATSYRFVVSDNAQFQSPQVAWKVIAATTTTLSGGWDSSNLTLQDGTTYYWRVSVSSGSCPLNYGSVRTFRTVCQEPGVPETTAPACDALLEAGIPSVELRWTATQHATSYVVELYDQSYCMGNPHTYPVQSNSKTIQSPPSGQYSWRVRAFNGDCEASEWSQCCGFEVLPCVPPELSYPISPDCEVILPGNTTQVPVTWHRADNATHYDVELYRGAACTGNPVFSTLTEATELTFTGLSLGEYYWRVRSRNQNCQPHTIANWSICCKFTIANCQTPARPLQLSPANGAELPSGQTSATLAWQTASGATHYQVYLYNNASCNGQFYAHRDVTAPQTSCTFDGLPPGSYTWKVRALNNGCDEDHHYSEWSECWSFLVHQGGITDCAAFADASFTYNQPNNNYCNDAVVYVGNNYCQSLDTVYFLMKFDLSQIPQDATVTSVELHLKGDGYSCAKQQDFFLEIRPAYMHVPWEECTATFWTSGPEGAHQLTPYLGSNTAWLVLQLDPDFVTAAQDWVTNPPRNQGLYIWSAQYMQPTGVGKFKSSESSSDRPYLRIAWH